MQMLKQVQHDVHPVKVFLFWVGQSTLSFFPKLSYMSEGRDGTPACRWVSGPYVQQKAPKDY
jgi:hypothetical protein